MTTQPEQRRKEAIKRYLNGEKVSEICRALSCSTSFLYRWRNRRNLAYGHNGWEEARSSRPAKSPTKTPEALCADIVRLKNALGKDGHRPGAPAIQQALREQGIEKAPSRRTIYRILARHEKEVKNPTQTS